MKHYYCLYSGGFDSTLALVKIISNEDSAINLTPVFFDYGQKSREKEIVAVQELIPVIREFAKNAETTVEECRIYKTSGLFTWSKSSILMGRPKEEDTGLESRNLVLLSLLSSIIMADRRRLKNKNRTEVITGFTNSYYDTSLKFVKAVNSFFEATKQRINVITPLIPETQNGEVDLNTLIDLARSLRVLHLLDRMAWSCYFPTKNGECCKNCDPCKKRAKISMALKREAVY